MRPINLHIAITRSFLVPGETVVWRRHARRQLIGCCEVTREVRFNTKYIVQDQSKKYIKKQKNPKKTKITVKLFKSILVNISKVQVSEDKFLTPDVRKSDS